MFNSLSYWPHHVTFLPAMHKGSNLCPILSNTRSFLPFCSSLFLSFSPSPFPLFSSLFLLPSLPPPPSSFSSFSSSSPPPSLSSPLPFFFLFFFFFPFFFFQNKSHPNGSKVVFYCGLDLHFLMITQLEYIFMCLLANCLSFWMICY